ncbi:alpha/beta hydrolase [Schumannella luteola]
MQQNTAATVSVVQTHTAPADLSAGIPISITVPAALPEPFVGPEPGASADLQGTRLLQQLSLLSAADIAEFLRANPASVDSLLANPPAARDVSMWWTAMDLDHRRAVQAASPELVGNLEGVPYITRDVANRQFLSETITKLNAVISSEDSGRTVVDSAKRQLVMLDSISTALGNPQSLPRRTLLSLDVEGQGKAAIVLGDLRTADYVSYLVPGMFFSIENQMSDWTDAAARLHEEELSWLELFGDSSSTVATVAWIGYQTPNLTNVGGIGLAEEGRDALARAIEGLQSIRGTDQPYLTIVAHSYGSTAALLALQEYDFEIDALALVGSPGSPAKSVDDLHVRNGNVWVGEAAWDPIPNSAYFGSDPGSASYGAKPMGVGGGIDVITGESLLASSGHNEYFSAGTESMRNFALISIGRGQYVTDGSAADASKTLPVLPHSL